MQQIHLRAIKYLEKDIDAHKEEHQDGLRQLLVDTLSYMRKTRPRII